MKEYDYFEAVKEDLKQYIKENFPCETREEAEHLDACDIGTDVYDDDSVTGGASGSYTFDRATAEEYLCGNIELLGEALEDAGVGVEVLREGAEACDVAIRQYVITQVIDDVLDELKEELPEEEEEEGDE